MLRSLLYNPSHVTPELQGDAWLGHIPFAYWLINEIKPTKFVELGTHGGGSYFSFCDSVLENGLNTKCYAVDSWKGDNQAGYYGKGVFNQVNSLNSLKFESFSTLYKSTFDSALDKFDNGSIELLHIDGFHTLEAVSHDYETWRPKLSDSAIVLFHDTQVFREDFGVHKFWSDLTSEVKDASFEFLHSNGLGVFCVNSEVNFERDFIPMNLTASEFRSFFEIAGSRIESLYRGLKKTVTPNEVLYLVRALSQQSPAHRDAIAKIVA